MHSFYDDCFCSEWKKKKNFLLIKLYDIWISRTNADSVLINLLCDLRHLNLTCMTCFFVFVLFFSSSVPVLRIPTSQCQNQKRRCDLSVLLGRELLSHPLHPESPATLEQPAKKPTRRKAMFQNPVGIETRWPRSPSLV